MGVAAGLLLILLGGTNGTLQITLEGQARQDGRSLVRARVVTAPDPLEGEDPVRPPLLELSCEDTISMPGGAVLIPARPAAKTSSRCRATLRGVEISLELPLSPAGPGLHAGLEPLSGNPGSTIHLSPFAIDTSGATLETESVRVGTSMGKVLRSPEGRYRVQTPASRTPQTLVLALATREGVGAAFLPLFGRTRLPVRAKRRASVTVRIAGREFGPVETRDGKAELELEVPPGVTHGTLRVTDRLGNARERPVDLGTPQRPRLAAVAAKEVLPVGERMRVAVAIADPRGEPADGDLPLQIAAFRGEVSLPRHVGPGLWTADYLAPDTVGADEIRVGVEGEDAIGHAVLAVVVKAGEPATLVVLDPEESHPPGTRPLLTVRVEDAVGNHLAHAPLEARVLTPPSSSTYDPAVESQPGAVTFTLPELVTPEGVRLEVRSENAREVVTLRMRPGPAQIATIAPKVERRGGQALISVTDRHGNPVGARGYQVATFGTRLQDPLPGDPPGLLRFAAEKKALEGLISIHGPEGELARSELLFGAAIPWHLGASASVSFASNLGSLNAALPALGLRVFHHRNRLEFSLGLELGLLIHRATLSAETPGEPATLEQRVTALDLPLLVGTRLKLGQLTGLFLELGPAFLPTRQVLQPDFQPKEVHASLVMGGRLRVGVDLQLGPGRLQGILALGRARLSQGPVLGQLDGLRVSLGYLLWLDAGARADLRHRD